jgi:hypothetical protein
MDKQQARYKAEFADLWIIFVPWHFPLHEDQTITGVSKKAEAQFAELYPAIFNHLLLHKDALAKRNISETGVRYEWYVLQRCAATYHAEFEKDKIVYAEIVYDSAFYYDTDRFYPEATTFCITGESLKFLTALLNSKLLTYAFRTFYAGGDLRGNTFRYKKVFLENLPIPKIDLAAQRSFEILVDQILTAKQNPPSPPFAKGGNKGADTSALEKQIDEMVYALYGLTPEEIAIVEGKG